MGGLLSLRHEVATRLQPGGNEAGSTPLEEEVDPVAQPLKDWLGAVDAVGRGSDAHMFLAVQSRARARARHGGGAGGAGGQGVEEMKSAGEAEEEASRLAELSCAAAHIVRYGRVEVGLLRSLMRVRERMATGHTVAARISALAWDMDRRSDPDNADAEGNEGSS